MFYAGFFPATVFWPLAVVVVTGSALGAARLRGGVPEALWSVWQAALGVIGLATLPQVSVFAPPPSRGACGPSWIKARA